MSDAWFEQVECTLCHTQETVHFPWGSYHLNLEPPLQVTRCKECSTLFMSPRPNSAVRQALMNGHVPEPLREYSIKTANYSAVTEGRLTMFRKRVEMLGQLVGNTTDQFRSLDIGASAGAFVQAAKTAGWASYGVEPSAKGVQTALRKELIFPQALAEDLPFPCASFNLVHAHHVYEHLVDPLKAAQEASRILKPGGLLFIEVPNQFDNIMFRRDMILRRVPQRERTIRSIHHLWFFSRRSLRLLLVEAGFENVIVTDTYGRPARGLAGSLFNDDPHGR